LSREKRDAVGPAAVLEGGPARIDSARYQIGAKAGDAASKEMMNGPWCERSWKSGFGWSSIAKLEKSRYTR